MKKIALLIIAATVFAILVFAGCTKKEPSSPGDTAATGTATQTVIVTGTQSATYTPTQTSTATATATATTTPFYTPVYVRDYGSSGSGNGQFSSANGIAVDSADNVYVTDYALDRIVKFNSSGVYQATFGGSGTGNGQFDIPWDIDIDTNGDMYITDLVNDRVQVLDSSGTYLRQWGSAGTGNNQFTSAQAIIISGSYVYVGDRMANHIKKFDKNGVWQATLADTGTYKCYLPVDIAVDGSGNFYVLNQGDQYILKYDSSFNFVTHFAGSAELTTPQGMIYNPVDQRLYVSDTSNNVIHVYSTAGVLLGEFGAAGTGNLQFNVPQYIEALSNGNLVIVDTYNYRIQEVNP